jgi:type IV fimbrial biogenesis protein FimT
MLIPRARGFTLIELMFGLALLAFLLMLAMPTFTTMLQNARLRNTAESILAGLQAARSEALRRNQTAEFMLTADDLDGAGTDGAGISVNTAGPHWAVRALDAAAAPIAYVEGRSGLEGSGSTDPATLFARITPTALPATNTIRFDPLGRTNAGVGGTRFDVAPADAATCRAAGGDLRCLRVVVTPGGRVRMCDPSVDAVATPNDTRAC